MRARHVYTHVGTNVYTHRVYVRYTCGTLKVDGASEEGGAADRGSEWEGADAVDL